MYKAFSKPRVLIRRRPSTSETTNTIKEQQRKCAEPESKLLSKRKLAMSESKKPQNPSIGINF
ncbi:uncharacterized protein EAE97_002797 [Botrytis byssoidea]|uniref:Uncharacterized protein n=1 Tax=Botrytis byssoidea TaxID=139641 RepID=A0A9P5M7R3_9HELO|nr:uncharacterized protein EAE97_002797 [Botrytis byssoidea]KAF7951246.1 hypothetical protein EAE97_002797 [Botrytis byssoidea]